MAKMIILYILVGIIIFIALWVLLSYNGLVVARNRVKEAYSQIDVQLKRRAALIPNLVEAVKGYASHEKEVFTKVTEARAALLGATSKSQQAVANDQLTGALKTLFAVAEAYPNLKASDNFKQLQEELSDTETKVAASRQFYNTNVLDYNTSLQVFPGSIIASSYGFSPEEYFKASEDERQDVKIQF